MAAKLDSPRLPIFEKGGAAKPQKVQTIKVAGVPVPVTQAESDALKTRLQEHQDTHGVSFGFFAQLLNMAPADCAPLVDPEYIENLKKWVQEKGTATKDTWQIDAKPGFIE